MTVRDSPQRGDATHQAGDASLQVTDLTLDYGGAPIVDGLTLAIPTAQTTVIIGANGCGKSTLLRGLGRLRRPSSGQVTWGGVDIWRMRPREFARQIALLPQQPIAPEGLFVGDLVARGRYPHQGVLRQSTSSDRDIVAQAIVDTEIGDLVERRVEELSGGQRQKVWIAMILAQQTPVALLDEPTTFLDVVHQVDVLDTLTERSRNSAMTLVLVLHDLNLAARYADHLVVMRQGRVVAAGAPDEILTQSLLHEAFGLDSRIIQDPLHGDPLVVPVSKFRRSDTRSAR